jgi:protein-S-isoprenylcysteine O-methyltransferase Ste14
VVGAATTMEVGLVQGLGGGLSFRSGVGVLLAALAIPPVLARIRSEERLLRARFDAKYKVYQVGTWRLVPWVY